ncbi:MAG: polyprenol monophosphomannose synthase [Desulfobacterales bacterium]|nr:polyprenol monophosphomannose synthase [Desulfobacterales bacterium]
MPVLQEAQNIPSLVAQIASALDKTVPEWELILVDDDSRDGTIEVCARLCQKGLPLHLLVRRFQRGLASAVVHGLGFARAPVLVVMDADLSHPSTSIPAFYQEIRNGFDFVVGSRYINGGGTDDKWTVYRYLNSKLACLLARPLTSINDPMSGFFAMSRRVWERCGTISPVGYKIGLEIMVKGHPERVKELPIRFRTRVHGESKLTIKQQWLYLTQLVSLYRHR